MHDEELKALPKAVLHDHLDGGLRVETVIDLADAVGHELPSHDVDGLAEWFHQGRSGSLERYLEAFVHTLGVMQTPEAIRRVAYEAGIDLAADGVVYAEQRFDPGLLIGRGLAREDVVEAALDGFDAARRETGISLHLIVCGLRSHDDTAMAAKAAVRFRDDGVVGYDLAGPEAGFPPDDHMEAISLIHRSDLGLTLHAGEGDGPHSVWRAMALCGAHRIGHGVHLVDATDFDGQHIRGMDRLPTFVVDRQMPLEVCITSNLHTATYASADVHPFGAMREAGFNVSLSTDNRLMSDVSMTSEYELARDAFDLSTEDLGKITVAAIMAGFGPWSERRRLVDEVVRPAYNLT